MGNKTSFDEISRKGVSVLILSFLVYTYSLISQDENGVDEACSELLIDATLLLSENIYGLNSNLEESYNTATKKKYFEKSAEFKKLQTEVKAKKAKLLSCKFNFQLALDNILPEYDVKKKSFLLFNGYISAEDIVAYGQKNSLGIVSLEDNSNGIRFREGKHSDSTNLFQIIFPKTTAIGDLPGPVGLYNAGRHYVRLDGLTDELIIEIEDCFSKECDLQWKLEFELLPSLHKWKYANSPMGHYVKEVIQTKNLKLMLIRESNGSILKSWKGVN